MGMNGGIHDAMNLSEKIVKVWNSIADESELDKYDAQRRPIAIDYVQQTTIRNKAMLEETDPDVRRSKHNEMSKTAVLLISLCFERLTSGSVSSNIALFRMVVC